jgi:hypothetical protein
MTNLMDFSADNGLVHLVLDARDRLMVDCWSDHLMDGGIMMAVLDPALYQQTGTKTGGHWNIHEFSDGIFGRLHGC